MYVRNVAEIILLCINYVNYILYSTYISLPKCYYLVNYFITLFRKIQISNM